MFSTRHVFARKENPRKNPAQLVFSFSESAYTERYMGLPLPTENFRGYQKSSVIDRLQWIRGKEFFLAHGMADRNVHVQNSMILAKTLVSQNVPFEQHVRSLNMIN